MYLIISNSSQFSFLFTTQVAGINGMAPITTMSSQVQISLKAAHVPNKDTFSKSDPFAVLWMVNPQTKAKVAEIGRTEVIKDDLNPNWVKEINMTYLFEETQTLLVEIYDCDSTSADLKTHKLIGFAPFTLGNVMGSRGTIGLNMIHHSGKVISPACVVSVHSEEVKNCNDLVHCKFKGVKLENKDGFFGCSDPFYVISKGNADGTWNRVWQSEVVMNNLNPSWKKATMPLSILCNGDHNRPLRIEVFDYDKDGTHDLIGACDTNLTMMLDGCGKAVPLVNPKTPKKVSGHVGIESIDFEKRFTTFDYIKGGCEMNLIYAIDYTGSNGDPKTPGTLHYHTPGSNSNAYQLAIQSIGNILQEYDTDRMYPTYGFGGFFNNTVYHAFPLSFNEAKPELPGVPGVLGAYSNSFQYVQLSGPTYFAPILGKVRQTAINARVTADNQKYFIVLIITDGAINDMPATIRELIELSKLPVSVVIVGVGNADFSSMNALDCDGGLLRDSMGTAARDVVQFVPYNATIAGKPNPNDALAKATLGEIPVQMISYFKGAGISPRTPMPPAFTMTGMAAALPGVVPPVPAAIPTAVPAAPAAPIMMAAIYVPPK